MSNPEDVNEIMRNLYGLDSRDTETAKKVEHRGLKKPPRALAKERIKEQNRRRVRRHYKANMALRVMHPEDWEAAVKAATKFDEAEPIVGDPCSTPECQGIIGMREGHRDQCPVGEAGDYSYE